MSFDVDGRRLPALDFTSHTFEIDTALYPVPAVHRACYALAACANFDIERTERGLHLLVTPRDGHQLDALLDDLKRLLVDFALREEIESKTKGLRDLIWRTAFAEARGRGAP
jgi:His-Xaa-Ser system protein HxsD